MGYSREEKRMKWAEGESEGSEVSAFYLGCDVIICTTVHKVKERADECWEHMAVA